MNFKEEYFSLGLCHTLNIKNALYWVISYLFSIATYLAFTNEIGSFFGGVTAGLTFIAINAIEARTLKGFIFSTIISMLLISSGMWLMWYKEELHGIYEFSKLQTYIGPFGLFFSFLLSAIVSTRSSCNIENTEDADSDESNEHPLEEKHALIVSAPLSPYHVRLRFPLLVTGLITCCLILTALHYPNILGTPETAVKKLFLDTYPSNTGHQNDGLQALNTRTTFDISSTVITANIAEVDINIKTPVIPRGFDLTELSTRKLGRELSDLSFAENLPFTILSSTIKLSKTRFGWKIIESKIINDPAFLANQFQKNKINVTYDNAETPSFYPLYLILVSSLSWLGQLISISSLMLGGLILFIANDTKTWYVGFSGIVLAVTLSVSNYLLFIF